MYHSDIGIIDTDSIQKFIKAGADINYTTTHSIMHTFIVHFTNYTIREILDILTSIGVNINNINFNTKNNLHVTPFMMAVYKRPLEDIKELLKYSIDTNVVNTSGHGIYSFALCNKDLNIFKYVLKLLFTTPGAQLKNFGRHLSPKDKRTTEILKIYYRLEKNIDLEIIQNWVSTSTNININLPDQHINDFISFLIKEDIKICRKKDSVEKMVDRIRNVISADQLSGLIIPDLLDIVKKFLN
jgi:hypothetical protein